MKGKIAGATATIIIALLILSVSILKSASIKYAYSPMVLSEKVDSQSVHKPIDYLLAYPGKIHPDNPLWYLKVVRDKTWYLFTFNSSKKSELNLLFADKRLNSARELFNRNKPDLGFSTLTKSSKYLEKAIPKDTDDAVYLNKLATAALKHREVVEDEILPIAPEDLRPNVIIISNYSKETYKKVRDLMLSKGLVPPEDAFNVK
ncbi:MAG: DUF5667 domain-containing protein [Patescibacteria group bacterium]